MKIKESINYLFNWKQNPASVFFIAGPLALIGFGSMLALALVHLHFNKDPWYLVIFLCGIALFVFAMWPIRHLIFKKT